jgi:hypothetical protein
MSVLKNGYEYMTSKYGNRTYTLNGKQVSDFHLGIDLISAKYGTDYIVAFADGKVIYAGYNGSYGNVVYIDHGNGYQTRYAHQKYLNVKVGDNVQKGDVLGYMGTTGNSTGNHVHFEVRLNGNTIDPYDYVFNGKTIDSNTDYTGVITYQAYTDKWLPEVYKCDESSEGYAGIGNEPITGLRAKPQFGKIYMQVSPLNQDYLEEICSDNYSDDNYNSYAGILGKPIDRVRIKVTKGYASYRVKTREDGWLAWVDSRTTTGDNSFAGIKGHTIIGIQMK